MLQPATKTRFEIGVSLKGHEASGMLEAITAANALCSHIINVTGVEQANRDVIEWLHQTYNKTG